MTPKSTLNDCQKSLIISTSLFGCILALLFFIRFWPPTDVVELAGGGGGVTVNFGNSDIGMGQTFDNTTSLIQEELQPEQTLNNPDENSISEKNSNDEGVVIPKQETVVKPNVVHQKSEKVAVIQKPQRNETSNTALANILKGAKKAGDGNTITQGNQGSANGSLSSRGYALGGKGSGEGNGNGEGTGVGNGNGSGAGTGKGIGTGSGYSLNGRKAVTKPKPDSSCSNETGVVVVEVTVDKNGTTIHVVVGKRGSTITAKCLKDQAKQAAMSTKWAPNLDGSEIQIGEIIYTFGLN